MRGIIIFAVTIALVVGMIGCEPSPTPQYNLTISSTAGGEVTVPGEGAQGPYDRGTEVDLAASPADGYRFVDWTGDVETISDIEATETTIIMDSDYAITANFEEIPAIQHELTISSTAGGSVTTPGEGTFTYDAGTVVELLAEATNGYQFTYWAGDIDTIADVNVPSTIVTMNMNCSVVANFETIPPGPVGYQNPRSYRVEYVVTVHNQGFGIDELRVYQPRPVEWDAQRNVQVEEVSPAPTHEGSDPMHGNGMYHWQREGEPPPGKAISFKILFSLTAYETESNIDADGVQPYDEGSPLYALYTQSERFIEAADPQIAELAGQVADGETNPYLRAGRFYDYVVDTVSYKLLGEGLRGAKALVETGVGECGDYAALFCALCRAMGIPARPVVGYWATSGIEQTHVWAEFYVEPFGWIPVDPTVGQAEPEKREYYFGAMDNRRVILNKGYNLQLDPPGPGDYSAPYLQVPLWWFSGSSGDPSSMRIERTAWTVEETPMIYGYIKDETGRPVEMTVVIDAFDLGNQGWVVSDADGYYEKRVSESMQYIVSAEPRPAKTIGRYSFPTGYLKEKRLVTRNGSELRVDFTARDGGTLWLQAYDESGNEIFRHDFLDPLMFGAFSLGTFPHGESIQARHGGLPLFWGWVEESDMNTACLLLPPEEPVVLWGPWRLPEVGTTFLHADNDGEGFSVQRWEVLPINLVYEFARTEYRETAHKYEEVADKGYSFSKDISNWLDEAKQDMASAESYQTQGLLRDAAIYSYRVLRDVVMAREQMVLEKAQQDIERFRKIDITVTLTDNVGNRLSNTTVEYQQLSHDFVFSIGWPSEVQYGALRDAGFEYANFETWWGQIETSDGIYSFPDSEAQKLKEAGFGLAMLSSIWLTSAYDRATPPFVAKMSPAELSSKVYEYSHDIVAHYSDELRIYCLLNEPDLPQAFNFTLDELVGIVNASARGAKTAKPDLPLFVNIGMPIFGRCGLDPVNYLVAYDMFGNPYPEKPIFDPPVRSGYDFVKALIEADVNFDTIGLEFYYGVVNPTMDLSLFSDTLDFYGALGKAIYVSELSYATLDDYPGLTKWWSKYGGWHEGYTDQAQADWAEYAMTVAFSKPYVSGIQWVGAGDGPLDYDFLGDGLFHKDGSTPRPALNAIKDLVQSWRTQGRGITNQNGSLTFRGFAGHYRITITTSDGSRFEREIHVTEQSNNEFALVLQTLTRNGCS